MIDHVTLHVADLGKSRSFFLSALAPLGAGGFPDLWLDGDGGGKPTHVAFRADDRAVVDRFHEAAMAAGAKDNGAPGPRPEYTEDYYGAFVLDPDGNNIEAVCHESV